MRQCCATVKNLEATTKRERSTPGVAPGPARRWHRDSRALVVPSERAKRTTDAALLVGATPHTWEHDLRKTWFSSFPCNRQERTYGLPTHGFRGEVRGDARSRPGEATFGDSGPEPELAGDLERSMRGGPAGAGADARPHKLCQVQARGTGRSRRQRSVRCGVTRTVRLRSDSGRPPGEPERSRRRRRFPPKTETTTG